MRRRVTVGVLLGLVGAFVAPTVALADDCSGLADCYGTVQGAIAALLGGGLIYGALAGFLSKPGKASKNAGKRAEAGAASGAAQGGPSPHEPGASPGNRETTTPPGRRDINLYPPGGPPEKYTDMTTKEGEVIHWETKPDGSASGFVERPDRTVIEVDRRPDGSATERYYGPDGQLVGTREIGPDKSSTYTTPPETHPDGSVSQSKADYGPDGKVIDYETSTASPDGTTTTKTTLPDGSGASQTTYPDGRGSTTVTQSDGTSTERNFLADGQMVSETTTSSPGSSHFNKL